MHDTHRRLLASLLEFHTDPERHCSLKKQIELAKKIEEIWEATSRLAHWINQTNTFEGCLFPGGCRTSTSSIQEEKQQDSLIFDLVISGDFQAEADINTGEQGSSTALPRELDQCLDFIGLQMIPNERDQIGKLEPK